MEISLISIDIGYSNLAFIELKTNFIDFKVIGIHKVNLKNFEESQVHLAMKKFINEYASIFDKADTILIERQPPQGLTNIQDILAYKYSSKVKLICPRTIHKYFYISKLDYNSRKVKTEKISNIHLKEFTEYTNEDRKHDIADAFCQALYYIHVNKPEIVEKKIPEDLINFFDSFKYTKAI